MIHPSRPFAVEPIRPDVKLFESDAGPGDIALVVLYKGQRVIRVEVAEAMYSPDLADRVLRFVESNLPPLIALVRDDASEARP
jgi:hypothetical protein